MNAVFPRPRKDEKTKTPRLEPVGETSSKKKSQTPTVSKQVKALLVLEAKLRDAHTLSELQFTYVNDALSLSACKQIILFSSAPEQPGWRIEKLSSISQVNRSSPLLQWFTKTIRQQLLKSGQPLPDTSVLDLTLMPDMGAYPYRHGIFIAVKNRSGNVLGGVACLSDVAFKHADIAILKRATATLSHAWFSLKPKTDLRSRLMSGKVAALTVGFVILLGLIPVKLTVMAPVQVVAKNPAIASAPLAGVIREVFVSPDQAVKRGELLFRYHDLELNSRYEISTRDLAVSEARLQQARQASFGSGSGRKDLATAEAEYQVALAQQAFAYSQLEKVDVTANVDGVVLFSGRDEWSGRPVAVGESVMLIANPEKVELKLEVPVSDSIILETVSEANIFLDSNPLSSFPASIIRKSYAPQQTESGILAYKLIAELTDNHNDKRITARIGARGTAQLKGRPVPLVFNLLRKPISAIRQFLGV